MCVHYPIHAVKITVMALRWPQGSRSQYCASVGSREWRQIEANWLDDLLQAWSTGKLAVVCGYVCDALSVTGNSIDSASVRIMRWWSSLYEHLCCLGGHLQRWTTFGAERKFARHRGAKRRSPCLILDGNKEGFKGDQVKGRYL